MKVYLQDGSALRPIGEASILDEGHPVYTVRLFGPASTIEEHFHLRELRDARGSAERVIIAASDALVELLPGWRALGR